jgi:hypothetical protein
MDACPIFYAETMKKATTRSDDKSRVGRPPKFREPRRPVTVTLPERTLRLLGALDSDRARAIVKVADAAMSPAEMPPDRLVEVVEVMPGVGIILVGASRSLRQISWLRLVEVAPARFLLSIASGTPVESLEIALHDLVETVSDADPRERIIVERLRALIRTLRRGRSISKAEMLFVDTRGRTQGALRGPGDPADRREADARRAGTAPAARRRAGPRL